MNTTDPQKGYAFPIIFKAMLVGLLAAVLTIFGMRIAMQVYLVILGQPEGTDSLLTLGAFIGFTLSPFAFILGTTLTGMYLNKRRRQSLQDSD